ncbi:copper chaperone PCu(A)C [Brachybacterium tyrofermentans]|uniref:copper chaperone PCu(A)C n=1 Tax=Brachybacterium tyrofermentans TaxID=47848 RepID=UPI00186956F5|nr:copper chaperone PCu(A)C [Brachybacterium tyrofermentans]
MFRISRTTSTTRTTRIPARSVVLPRRAALASLLALPLAACSAGADGGSAASDEGAGAASDGGAAAGSGAISVTDPWVKAADEGMTAAFGTITNGTDADLVLTAVTTPATDMVQLHETTSDGSGGMSMQEKDGGFPLPAGEDLVLEPGGDHIMLMDLPKPLQPGDTLELTLVFSEGTEHPFTATVKDFSGAQEHYAPGEDDEEEADHEGMSGMASDGGGEHEGHK